MQVHCVAASQVCCSPWGWVTEQQPLCSPAFRAGWPSVRVIGNNCALSLSSPSRLAQACSQGSSAALSSQGTVMEAHFSPRSVSSVLSWHFHRWVGETRPERIVWKKGIACQNVLERLRGVCNTKQVPSLLSHSTRLWAQLYIYLQGAWEDVVTAVCLLDVSACCFLCVSLSVVSNSLWPHGL